MKKVILPVLALCALSACEAQRKTDNGQYWQRVNASELAYTQGPKAQQMLQRDISRCVAELRELERIGQIKDPIPTNIHGRVLDPDENHLQKNEVTDRDGFLLAEHSNYHDFEGCMVYNGWERVKHVPYDVAKKGTDYYWASLGDHIWKPTDEKKAREENDYQLNE